MFTRPSDKISFRSDMCNVTIVIQIKTIIIICECVMEWTSINDETNFCSILSFPII